MDGIKDTQHKASPGAWAACTTSFAGAWWQEYEEIYD
jgi:hypothetical protein